MTPARLLTEARTQEVDEALAILNAASNTRVVVTERHSVCWCTDGLHHPLVSADQESAGEAITLAERMSHTRAGVHRLHDRYVTAVIREEIGA